MLIYLNEVHINFECDKICLPHYIDIGDRFVSDRDTRTWTSYSRYVYLCDFDGRGMRLPLGQSNVLHHGWRLGQEIPSRGHYGSHPLVSNPCYLCHLSTLVSCRWCNTEPRIHLYLNISPRELFVVVFAARGRSAPVMALLIIHQIIRYVSCCKRQLIRHDN
jgi:hypothetical protein